MTMTARFRVIAYSVQLQSDERVVTAENAADAIEMAHGERGWPATSVQSYRVSGWSEGALVFGGDLGLTNGYPDPEAHVKNLREELADARQQLAWCDRPGDDAQGWEDAVKNLERELKAMGQ